MDRIGYTRKKEKGEREVMKRIRLLILLSVLAVALPVGLLAGVAKGAGSTGATSQLSINQNAQYDALGGIIHVGLRARCPFIGLDPITQEPIPGTIKVHVEQDPPESTFHAEGDNFVKDVVCDGQTHTVGATVFGTNFDAGRAYATAAFTFPPSATATAAKWINIIVMPG
jgi:hypothetical protein